MTTTRKRPRSDASAKGKAIAIPPPNPELTPEGMVNLARSMREALRSRQDATEQGRRILDETNRACVEAGFYRTLQPRRFGGYEFDLPTFAKVMIELSRGCPSTGWVVAFTAGHAHVLAKYPEQAQAEVYGADGEFRGPFVGGTNAYAVPVEGGYLLNGTWDYASGIDTSTHFFGGCSIKTGEEAGPAGTLVALIHRDEFEIEHNWEMLGMRGTGSHRVIVKDVFVPSHRAMERNLLIPVADQSSLTLFDNPMYVGPSMNILMGEIAAVAIGTGYGALDCFEDILTARDAPRSTTRKRSEDREFQVYFGQAMAILDTARAALIGCTSDFMDYCRWHVEGREPFTAEKASRIVLVEQQCCKLAGDAVTLMARTAGTQAARPGQMMQRYYRDMTTLLTHHTLMYDRNQEAVARTHFGIEQPQPDPGSADSGARSASGV
jgi:3-hydroxy-9,10-secoandrosta-1,3,5(10)-triene-9,17-dione monooxygenase